ncbi:MAG: aminotransferase class IV [Bacteroidetes bacterium]|nr:aminotransferase class IV [Bacteroidota bacterium]
MIQATGSHFIISNKLVSVDEIDYCLQDQNDIIYEVIRFTDFKPLFLQDHLERFLLNFYFDPETIRFHKERLTESLHKLINENGQSDGNIRFQFNHNLADSFCAWLVPHTYPTREEYEKGVLVKRYCAERQEPNIKSRDIKLRVDTDQFIKKQKIYEAILINDEGQITEGSRSNIFFIQKNIILTPPLSMVLPGITRQKILSLIEKNQFYYKECIIKISEIQNFESCFISGTSPKILPVAYFDEKRMEVNNKLLLKLIELYNQHIDNYLKDFRWNSSRK